MFDVKTTAPSNVAAYIAHISACLTDRMEEVPDLSERELGITLKQLASAMEYIRLTAVAISKDPKVCEPNRSLLVGVQRDIKAVLDRLDRIGSDIAIG